MAKHRIIIDTDPGQDDAVALLLALASPDEIDILGIVAVAGNVGLQLTSANARRIVELAGRPEVPVYAGCARPMRRRSVTGEHVHGRTGLDGSDLPPPALALQPGHGVDFIIDTLRNEPPQTVTLCTLGPLTNVAMALVKAPDIAERIVGIVMMGGAYFEVGNITPTAEFNIYVDPEAADTVFTSGIPMTVLPLDVTHKVLSRKKRLDRIRAIGNRAGATVHGMLSFSERFDEEKYGQDGGPLHDPTVIAYLLRPDLFRGREVNVRIETGSPLTAGMTVVDWWRVTGLAANALYIKDIDDDAFFDLLTERLARLP